METSLFVWTTSSSHRPPASSTPSVSPTTGPSRIKWTHLVLKMLRVIPEVRFEGCDIYAYDHTITAPARRGGHIRYFKTGVGKGSHLKRLETLIQENNHTNSKIDYLKVTLNGDWLRTVEVFPD